MSRSTPVSLAIPAINMSGSLIATGMTNDGRVQVPADYKQASWYQPGPAPGEKGSAVILGHVDNVAGPGVFIDLKKLKKGDTVDVKRADGKTAHFAVTDIQSYLKTDFPNQQVFGGRDQSQLQLVTCGGDFDAAARSYKSNVVVYSSLVSTT
ncbi:class F sortase [Skermania piniformis]|uniref:Class F sortase n=1 Tax=Skermania pinensis TaxID=39122 RepID=A0ABX8SCT2_9ACTN|nr:class F sortase [Skermania piniformis]